LDFYTGDIGQLLGRQLAAAGSPITRDDLAAYEALVGSPLSVPTQRAQLFNLGPPTQGLASLIILALYDRLYQASWGEAQRVHHLIEATKIAFTVRDNVIGHRTTMAHAPEAFLTTDWLDQAALDINSEAAAPWPNPSQSGDTVWMGALDSHGNMVSFIQSLYWEFGSGLVIPELGVVWNNRGVSFNLEAGHANALGPGRRPLHTLNPAFAELNDGRRMVYGTMGGEGQPQTQAALFTRHVYDGLPLAAAIANDRWLLGRTWGEASTNLKLEQRLFDDIGPALLAAGHDAVAVPSHIEAMGHAGAIALDSSGQVEAATDPRSDGAALVAAV
jgi:gamma-glutamyltranspeptidase/glutathione hydrolase